MINSPGRNHLIDGLRFLAACGIVLYHLNLPASEGGNWYQTLCGKLWLGVPVFFVISGYCIFIAIGHTKTAGQFIVRRFFRIFPAYWFSLFVVALAVAFYLLVTGINSVTVIPRTVPGILATLTLLTDPFSEIHTVNGVYWSLTYEVFFYVVVYLVILLNNRYWLPVIIGITLIAAALPVQQHGFLFWMRNWPVFSFGIALYYIIHNRQQLYWGLLLFVVSITGIIAINDYPPYYILCFATGLLIIANSRWPLGENALSKPGDYSYGIYLLHIPVCCNILSYYRGEAIQNNILFNITFDVVMLIIVVLLSALVYNYIEKPFINLGKRSPQKT
ncbi:acyltransferase [Mucilaginibacter sp. ZT4R22]|uniref:Acyltransferase n=1 Tax=Mucilaginibacter pankratovii TaxID=2772110 RepID=A0ABR7WUB0_9SPHI|nr:acyltransferase [Mucilaginibacter pankratovii]MBD1365888.1 acyltransferase [Mucilaginibacter pankratovii]